MVARKLLLLTMMLISAGSILATPQIPDILIYEGASYPIYEELLGVYFKRFPERKPVNDDVCSANWRGYIATFEVRRGVLALKDFVADSCGTSRPALSTVVPDGKPLFIDWYSGLLLSLYGRNDADPYSLSWLDSSENYSLFEVDAGHLRRAKHFTNAEYLRFRKRQFAEFKKTPEYKAEVREMTANGRLNASDADANLLMWVFSKTKKFLID